MVLTFLLESFLQMGGGAKKTQTFLIGLVWGSPGYSDKGALATLLFVVLSVLRHSA